MMKNRDRQLFSFANDCDEKESIVQDELLHYSRMKSEQPEVFERFSQPVFQAVLKSYLTKHTAKQDVSDAEEYSLVETQLKEDFNFEPDAAQTVANTAIALIKGMELPEPSQNTIDLMRSIDVGAEEQKIIISQFKAQATSVVDKIFGSASRTKRKLIETDEPHRNSFARFNIV